MYAANNFNKPHHDREKRAASANFYITIHGGINVNQFFTIKRIVLFMLHTHLSLMILLQIMVELIVLP